MRPRTIFCAVMTAMMLAGCGPDPNKVVAVGVIPDNLPSVDPKLLVKRGNPNCVKDKRSEIPVPTLVGERDCFKDEAKGSQGQLHALIVSVNKTNAAIDKLRTEQKTKTESANKEIK